MGGEPRIPPGHTQCVRSAGCAAARGLTEARNYNASFVSLFKY